MQSYTQPELRASPLRHYLYRAARALSDDEYKALRERFVRFHVIYPDMSDDAQVNPYWPSGL